MKIIHCLLLIVLVATACSTTGVNVPAISDSAASEQLPGKIVWHELLTDTPEQTQQFYNGLFGWTFEPLQDERINYLLIRHRGELIGGMIDQNRLPTEADISQWVVLLAVSNIALATRVVRESGGTVFTPPTSLGDRGEIAVVADPQGALFALLQTREGEPADRGATPMVGGFLWDELWTDQPDAAAGFYRKLAPYQLQNKTLEGAESPVKYQVLSTNNTPRAAIRDNPVDHLPPIWVNYLRVADEAELDAILARVEPLGGHILVPAMHRPGGGSVAIIAGPSGAGIALQTWVEGQTLKELEGEES